MDLIIICIKFYASELKREFLIENIFLLYNINLMLPIKDNFHTNLQTIPLYTIEQYKVWIRSEIFYTIYKFKLK